MASSSKQRTTFAKLNREQKVREKRVEKANRREARKRADAIPATAEVVVDELEVEIDLDKHPAVTGEQI